MNQALYSTIHFFCLCTIAIFSGCSQKENNEPASRVKDSNVERNLSTNKHLNKANDTSHGAISYTPIEWTDLLPDHDLEALENPPEYLANIVDGSEDDQLPSQLKAEASANSSEGSSGSAIEHRYQQALTSQDIRPEFNGRHVRIPGFIVPLEFDDLQTITTFFLVPFFGACIHMPPPPPNQIIYAEYEPGMRLEALYDPFWINGTLTTNMVENDMATAAYSLTVSAIEPYTEFVSQEDEFERE